MSSAAGLRVFQIRKLPWKRHFMRQEGGTDILLFWIEGGWSNVKELHDSCPLVESLAPTKPKHEVWSKCKWPACSSKSLSSDSASSSLHWYLQGVLCVKLTPKTHCFFLDSKSKWQPRLYFWAISPWYRAQSIRCATPDHEESTLEPH